MEAQGQGTEQPRVTLPKAKVEEFELGGIRFRIRAPRHPDLLKWDELSRAHGKEAVYHMIAYLTMEPQITVDDIKEADGFFVNSLVERFNGFFPSPAQSVQASRGPSSPEGSTVSTEGSETPSSSTSEQPAGT